MTQLVEPTSHHNSFEVCELINPTQEIAAQLGKQMLHLTDEHDGSPIDMGRLERTAQSTSAAQFIARVSAGEHPLEISGLGKCFPVLGAATVSTRHGLLGEGAWLEDFVVVPEAREFNVAQMTWDAMSAWRIDRDLNQMRFTSSPDKVRAHGFYKRNGCEILAEGKTTMFVHNL